MSFFQEGLTEGGLTGKENSVDGKGRHKGLPEKRTFKRSSTAFVLTETPPTELTETPPSYR